MRFRKPTFRKPTLYKKRKTRYAHNKRKLTRRKRKMTRRKMTHYRGGGEGAPDETTPDETSPKNEEAIKADIMKVQKKNLERVVTEAEESVGRFKKERAEIVAQNQTNKQKLEDLKNELRPKNDALDKLINDFDNKNIPGRFLDIYWNGYSRAVRNMNSEIGDIEAKIRRIKIIIGTNSDMDSENRNSVLSKLNNAITSIEEYNSTNSENQLHTDKLDTFKTKKSELDVEIENAKLKPGDMAWQFDL